MQAEGAASPVPSTLAEDAKGNLFYNISADVEGWRTKKGDPSNLPAVSNAGESGSPIQAEAAAPPVTSRLTEEGAGVNPHAGARQRGQLFPIKKAPHRVLRFEGLPKRRYQQGD